AGLEQVLQFLETIEFTKEEVEWLAGTGRLDRRLLDYLSAFRFTGDVHAMPEGTPFFQNEPILRITAPIPQAQLIETRLINLLHYQVLVASKAVRTVLAAGPSGKLLVDFGLRRAHGAEAGLLGARAAYLAGFSGSSNVLAEREFGIPAYGTMAHSFIQAFDDESSAFESFAVAQPQNVVLLIDTYDTEAGAKKTAALAHRLKRMGIQIKAVRLDSGNLGGLAHRVRRIFDKGGLPEIGIFASGNLDEHIVGDLIRSGAPIDGFGIGTRLLTSSDAPYLDCAYKLQEYAGKPRRKRSTGKATWPGRKQVYRYYDRKGEMRHDVLTLEDDARAGVAKLIRPYMLSGKRVGPPVPLSESRARAASELTRLPRNLRQLTSMPPYPVKVSSSLRALARWVDKTSSEVSKRDRT
ncbi:MAG TPA: nicotinate phosphoribosyltransferase, partial [Nitrospiria bacterium]